MAISCIDQSITDRSALYHGDSVEILGAMPSSSVDYMIYSPPFASLYTYSNSERDLGNCKSRFEFFEHYSFVARELYRILKPGRLLSFHCMNLPTTKERYGFIGINDFRGGLIAAHERCLNCGLPRQSERDDSHGCLDYQGMIFHSEVCIWKDPVTAMQRTKAIGLLYKQLRKDSCISRQGIPDYLVSMRKPGENVERVTKTHESFPVSQWQNYASPVWMDIDPSDTLQRESAREHNDERHICPLQLQVIERGIELWTNPGDVVLSPYAGIGSEGYVALRGGRRFIGIELKDSYYAQARKNLLAAEQSGDQPAFEFDHAPRSDDRLRGLGAQDAIGEDVLRITEERRSLGDRMTPHHHPHRLPDPPRSSGAGLDAFVGEEAHAKSRRGSGKHQWCVPESSSICTRLNAWKLREKSSAGIR